ncbi:MAG TPA: SCO family protein [Pyrinomonadaceae bacterium]|nr:SCO family protein [Pyrinomonadaceae bacterium]
MRYLFFLALAALILNGCQGAPTQQANTTEAKRYDLKGKVISVDREKKTAKIDHEEIKGYMAAMEMEFPIHEDWVWDDLTPGSEIKATLVVDNSAKDPYWLEKIGILAAPKPGQAAPPVDERFAQIGKEIPDFQLTNQDGKRISTKDFRGKALAITFIYAKCPLPDYCIKMSVNFSDAANRVMSEPEARDKFRLLTISFDPERDTPAKLKEYGLGYLGKDAKPDFSVWQLAVGSDKEVRSIADFFGLRYEVDPTDKTQFNHSLRTAVIAPDGKVTKIFSGNEWSADDLIREMKAANTNTGTN